MVDKREIVPTVVKLTYKLIARNAKVSSKQHIRRNLRERLNGMARLVRKE